MKRQTELTGLVNSIRAEGARLAIPNLVDLSDLAADPGGITKIVLESIQEWPVKLALQLARDDYETRRERQRPGVQLAKSAGKYAGRIGGTTIHKCIVEFRGAGQTIQRTAELSGCSPSQVKRIKLYAPGFPISFLDCNQSLSGRAMSRELR